MSIQRCLVCLLSLAFLLVSSMFSTSRARIDFGGTQDGTFDKPAVAFLPDRDVFLRIKHSRVDVDGKELFRIGGETGGFVIWFHSPKYGRFIFSTRQHPKYEFEEVAVIDNSRIVFRSDAREFEWSFQTPLVEKGNLTHLWMMHDQHPEPIKDRNRNGGSIGASTFYEPLFASR
jgi:hypothetical protein